MGGYTSGHRRQLGGLLVEFHVHGLDHHLSGAACLRIHGGPHERLGTGAARSELDKAPVGRVAAGSAVVARSGAGTATDAHAHHGAAYALLASGAATGHGDVLPDHFPRLWVIDPLRVRPDGIADHVSPLAQRAPGGVSADPLGEKGELSL